MLHWDVHDIRGQTKSATLVNLFGTLDAIVDPFERMLDGSYDVLVENQPSRTSSIMKAIQLGIVSYFAMRAYQRGERPRVREVSARLKLSDMPRECVRPTTYRERKLASIARAQAILSGSAVLSARLARHSKKDDMTDAFLYVACSSLTGFRSIAADPCHLDGASRSTLLAGCEEQGSDDRAKEDRREDQVGVRIVDVLALEASGEHLAA